MEEYTKQQIIYKVYENNTIEKFKELIDKPLKEIIKQHENETILNKNGTIKKKIGDLLSNTLEQLTKEFNLNIIPFYKDGKAYIRTYIHNTEYDINVKINLNYDIENTKNKDYQPNIYSEDWLYIGRIEYKEDVENKWNHPKENKILKSIGQRELKYYDLAEILAQSQKIEDLKNNYETEKDKIGLYSVKKLL